MRQLADGDIDKTPGAPFELNVERREKGDPVFQDRSVPHDFNGVGFYDRLEIKHDARECCVKIGPDCSAAIGHEKRVIHTVAEPNAGTLCKRMVRRHYRTQLADSAGKHLQIAILCEVEPDPEVRLAV